MVRVSVTPRGPDGGDQAGPDAGTGYVTLCYSDTSQAHPAPGTATQTFYHRERR